MPVSGLHNISPIMKTIMKMGDLKKVLDVGVGFGKYGVLLRERLDIRLGRYNRDNWKVRIDGIEIWADYISDLHRYIYDQIFIGDVFDFVKNLNQYDLILLIDVLEHFDKPKGFRLLRALNKKCDKNMIICVPQSSKSIGKSKYYKNNPYEEHKTIWVYEEIKIVLPSLKKVNQCVYYFTRGN